MHPFKAIKIVKKDRRELGNKMKDRVSLET